MLYVLYIYIHIARRMNACVKLTLIALDIHFVWSCKCARTCTVECRSSAKICIHSLKYMLHSVVCRIQRLAVHNTRAYLHIHIYCMHVLYVHVFQLTSHNQQPGRRKDCTPAWYARNCTLMSLAAAGPRFYGRLKFVEGMQAARMFKYNLHTFHVLRISCARKLRVAWQIRVIVFVSIVCIKLYAKWRVALYTECMTGFLWIFDLIIIKCLSFPMCSVLCNI